MNWFESLVYGLLSGITEFLPISSFAHRQLLYKMLDISGVDPLQSLLVHIALIAAVLTGCRSTIEQFYRAKRTYRKNHSRMHGSNSLLELRFLQNAVLPMLIGYFVLSYFLPIKATLVWIAGFSFINFLILIFQSRMMQGNKDERIMSVYDSFVIGLSASISALPGISRICVMLTAATQRGIDKLKAINWVLLLSVPLLAVLSLIDIFNLITATGAVALRGNVIGYILSTAGAYISGYLGVLIMKYYAYRKDISDFAYYSFGVMIFTLFLYLTVV